MLKIKSFNNREVKKLEKISSEIIAKEDELIKISDKELKERSLELKSKVGKGININDLLIDAFAIAREATFRVLGKRQYNVQILGGIALHQGRIVEMKTGEGKTITEICPTYLNALEGKGVHIITVNEYLAERDMNEMKDVFEFLGLTVGIIKGNSEQKERIKAYNKDITYITNSEVGFDYLRDHLSFKKHDLVQRGLNFAILDEIDSILIDEARTPLIISDKNDEAVEIYKKIDSISKSLNSKDFEIIEDENSIALTEIGIEKIEKAFNIKMASIESSYINHYINQSLRANYMMFKDKDYIIMDDEIVIIDEFTGRIADGRRFSDGLHQAIEAKEGVKIKSESTTVATITYQNLFKLYKKLSGMSGTCKTEEEEIREIYDIDVVAIPTNKPIKRIDHQDKVFLTQTEKLKEIVADVKKSHDKGNPVLICTQSIKKSEELSSLLKKENLKHKLLNAKLMEEEARIISEAGKFKSITIATNMAGRGTNIKISKEVNSIGGLKVIGAERSYSKRVDNQLIGRAGRQGQNGETQFYVSLEDDLIKSYGKRDLIKFFNNKKRLNKYIDQIQKRVEFIHYDERKNMVKFDEIVNNQRKIIYSQRESLLNGKMLNKYTKGMLRESIENGIEKVLRQNNFIKTDFEEDMLAKKKICIDIFDFVNRSYLGLDLEVILFDELDMSENIEELIKYLNESLYEILIARINKNEKFFKEIETLIMLPIIDQLWMEHIEKMFALRREVSMVSFKQQDPFQIYKIKGKKEFEKLIKKIRIKYIEDMFKMSIFKHVE